MEKTRSTVGIEVFVTYIFNLSLVTLMFGIADVRCKVFGYIIIIIIIIIYLFPKEKMESYGCKQHHLFSTYMPRDLTQIASKVICNAEDA